MAAPHFMAEGTAAVAAIAAGSAAFAYASLSAQSQLFGRTLVAGSDPQQIALTYDDGPNDAATLDLLDLLAKQSVRATFFMIGSHVRRCGPIARAVHEAGHLIGNHTATHPWLVSSTPARTRQEFLDCNRALEDTIGAPIRYTRFPHGARAPYTVRIACSLGLVPVQWNIMAHDWEPIGVNGIMQRVVRGLTRAQHCGVSANICMHDGHQASGPIDRSDTLSATAQILERLTPTHKFVTVDAWG